MDNISNIQPLTPENVMATVMKIFAESDAKFEKRMADSAAEMKQSRAEFNKRMAESDARFDQRMKKLDERIGGTVNNLGFIAEEYFFNSFEQGQRNFFGETFDEIRKNVKGTETDDEFDVVMINGHSLAVVEVKLKAHENDVPKILKKAQAFRKNFDKYKNHKIYLGLASMAFYNELEKECKNQGIAIIKQVGDTIVIHDNNLKVF